MLASETGHNIQHLICNVTQTKLQYSGKVTKKGGTMNVHYTVRSL